MSGFVLSTARGQLRRQRLSYFGLAMVVALGGGAALGAAIAADRTDTAYREYVNGSEVAELVVNPSLSSVAMTAAIKGFDGVESVHTSFLLSAIIGDIESGVMGELGTEEAWLQVIGSPDGRFLDVDRPAVTSGRLPTGDHEVFVSHEVRPLLEERVGRRLSVGDTFEISFFWSGLFVGEMDYSQTVSSIGIESLRISGFGVLPDETLPEELFPRQRLMVSTDVARKYSCTADFNSEMTDEEAMAAAFPQNCSALYTYFSMQLDDRPGTAAAIREQFAAASDALSSQVPAFVAEQGAGYYYISQVRADLDAAVERAVRPTVVTLNLFAIIALFATVAVFGVAVARVGRRGEVESRRLMELGATTLQRLVAAVIPAVVAIALGIVGAVAIGALLSPIGPLGSVRSLASSHGISTPIWLVLAVVTPFAAGLAVMAAFVALSMVRRTWRIGNQQSRKPTRLSLAISALRRPSLTTGTNAALDLRRPGTAAAIVGCVVAVACVGGALIFDSNVRTLVEDPVEYGWPWDAAAVIGAGYGGANPATIAESLDDVADVEGYEVYGMDPSTQFDGRGVPVIYGFPNFDPPQFPIVSGRAARSPNEAVLGSNTAERLGIEIGDLASLKSTTFSDREVVIVGTAVLPSIGPFVSDRAGLGDGAFVMLDAPAELGQGGFVGIHLSSGANVDAFFDGVGNDALASWSDVYEPPLVLQDSARSPEIINVTELRSAPLLLIRLLALALFGGFALSIVVSVRDRQRELAILRVLGFRDSNLRASVRWQAFMMMLAGLIIGVPVGIVVGRTAWKAFADQLGVVPRASIPMWVLVATVVGSIVLAMLAAIIPARSVTRTKSGLVLRRS
ncbi:MAG: FtsX-like permease family protein [Ilumatobacteraceae bacterium]